MIVILVLISIESSPQRRQLNIDLPKLMEDSITNKNPDSSLTLIRFIKEKKLNPNSIYSLWIGSKQDWSYFQNNIQNFNKLEYINLTYIKIDDFTFLNNLKKLKMLKLIENKNINFISLIENLNSNPSIKHLTIQNKKIHTLPSIFNNLLYLNSLNIIGTKIKLLNLSIELKYLELGYNKKLIPSMVHVYNVSVISFDSNYFNSFAYQLQDSVNLEALIFSLGDDFNLNCPINGFKNLKLLDIFSTNLTGLKSDCFPQSSELNIIQQIRSPATARTQ